MLSGYGKRVAGEENGMRRLRGQESGVGPRQGKMCLQGKRKSDLPRSSPQSPNHRSVCESGEQGYHHTALNLRIENELHSGPLIFYHLFFRWTMALPVYSIAYKLSLKTFVR
jgi:hypothetical protein